jgi:hypothetical protein
MNERTHLWITVGGLVLVALLLLASNAVAGNMVGLPDAHSEDAVALQSNSFWSSGWVDIATDTAQPFTHDLGGNPDDYAVELWLRDTDPGGIGVNSRGLGGLEAGGNFYGAHWQNLTDTTIRVVRNKDDTFADQVRVDVWFPDPPAWDSGWVDIAPGTTQTLPHPVGGNVDGYVVGLWCKDTTQGGIGINTRGYGGLEAGGQFRGAAWQNLTNTTVDVLRYPDDPWADQVRVRIFVPDDLPAWDSGWVGIAPGAVEPFSHGLGGNPNLYVVREWQKDITEGGIGINHRFLGGFETDGSFYGTNWENLTDTSINVFRRPNDGVADQVRVRIWLREFKVYLPLVTKAHSGVGFSYVASDCLGPSGGRADGDQVEIWVEEHDIVMEHREATYNCCATMVIDLIDQRPLLQLIEQETYPQSGPCDCLCPYDLSARISNLSPGTYLVEVWNEGKTYLFGSAWVTVE